MIRVGKLADIPALVELGNKLRTESPRYAAMGYSPEKVAKVAHNVITSSDAALFVAEKDGVLIGMAMVVIEAEWFSDDLTATELTLFVDRAHRGGLFAPKLILAMDVWAKSKGVHLLQAGTTTGVDPERTAKLYEFMGFTRCAIGLQRMYN